MKAAVLVGKRKIDYKELPDPEPATGEVFVRVSYCGVCGSDVVRFRDGRVQSFPLILGHEFSGVVEEIGHNVDESLKGKHVVGVPLVPCMTCEECRAGNYSLCSNYSFIGSRQPGAFAQYITVPATNVFPISDAVDDIQAAFFEPATVALHAINLVSPRKQGNVAILGCGTIGIFLAQALKEKGHNIVAFVRSEVRSAAANAVGIDQLVNTSEDAWMQLAFDRYAPNGFDYVFDTSGNNELMVSAFALASKKGTICMVGTPKKSIEFSVQEWEFLNRKELTVKGSWMSYSMPFPGKEWEQAACLFAQGVLFVPEQMIDSIYTLDDIAYGMERLATPGAVSGKLLVNCQEEKGQ